MADIQSAAAEIRRAKKKKKETLSCDALRLGSKGRYGSFHLWINVWVAGKTV